MNNTFTFTFVWDESKAEEAMWRLWDEYGENFLDEKPYAYFYDIIDAVIYSAIFCKLVEKLTLKIVAAAASHGINHDTTITPSDMDEGTPLSIILQGISGKQLKTMRKQVLTKYKEKLIDEMNAEEE